ncbi:MAG: hypothetical protein LBD24_03620, partial [Spirochaetaceae bacterium]|nr:hypothetical protein [Spirochaetaceae bacterium]
NVSRTETNVSRTETNVSRTETNVSRTETNVSRTETNVSRLETNVSRLETNVFKLETFMRGGACTRTLTAVSRFAGSLCASAAGGWPERGFWCMLQRVLLLLNLYY